MVSVRILLVYAQYIVMDGHRPAKQIESGVFCWWFPAYWGYVHVGTLKYENLLTLCVCVCLRPNPVHLFTTQSLPTYRNVLFVLAVSLSICKKKIPRPKQMHLMKLEFWRHGGFFVFHAPKLKILLTKPILVKAKVDNHVLDCCAQKAAPVSRFYKVSIWRISRNLLAGGGFLAEVPFLGNVWLMVLSQKSHA